MLFLTGLKAVKFSSDWSYLPRDVDDDLLERSNKPSHVWLVWVKLVGLGLPGEPVAALPARGLILAFSLSFWSSLGLPLACNNVISFS